MEDINLLVRDPTNKSISMFLILAEASFDCTAIIYNTSFNESTILTSSLKFIKIFISIKAK